MCRTVAMARPLDQRCPRPSDHGTVLSLVIASCFAGSNSSAGNSSGGNAGRFQTI